MQLAGVAVHALRCRRSPPRARSDRSPGRALRPPPASARCPGAAPAPAASRLHAASSATTTSDGACAGPRSTSITVCMCGSRMEVATSWTSRLASLWGLCSNRLATIRPRHRFVRSSANSGEHRMSIERPWLASYPRGVPARDRCRRIPVDRLGAGAGAASATATRPPSPTSARRSPTTTSTGSARQFAAYLLGELKLKKGDRVAIMMPNCCSTRSRSSACCAPA